MWSSASFSAVPYSITRPPTCQHLFEMFFRRSSSPLPTNPTVRPFSRPSVADSLFILPHPLPPVNAFFTSFLQMRQKTLQVILGVIKGGPCGAITLQDAIFSSYSRRSPFDSTCKLAAAYYIGTIFTLQPVHSLFTWRSQLAAFFVQLDRWARGFFKQHHKSAVSGR